MGRFVRSLLGLVFTQSCNLGYVMSNASPRNQGRKFPTRQAAEEAALNAYERKTIYAVGRDGYLYEDDACTRLAPGRICLHSRERGSLMFREVDNNGEVVSVPLLTL